jgi:hypothetical protein
MNLMAVIVIFRFLMSASVDNPASHRAFSVRLTANTPSANLIALDAEPQASSLYLKVLSIIIVCIVRRFHSFGVG